MNKYIAWLTSILVFMVALGSFMISYNALRDINQQYGVSGHLFDLDLSYIWPLLIDFSLIVFSLCVVTAQLYNESTWRQWVLVGIYTLATIGVNTLHVWPDLLPVMAIKIIIACIPPVSLFFSFETLMSQLKSSVNRTQQQATITGYDTALRQAQNGFADLMQQMDSVRAGLIATIAEKDSQLSELQQQVSAANDPVTHRRDKVLALINKYRTEYGKAPTQAYLAEQAGVSVQTIRGDMAALNGRVR